MECQDLIQSENTPLWALLAKRAPWNAVVQREDVILSLGESLATDEWKTDSGQFIHHSAIVETGATLKGPCIIGPGCFVSASALIRDAVILGPNCTVGHCSEVKSSILLGETALAHFNFVGDSILGPGVNLESGSVIANCRNEYPGERIILHFRERIVTTGLTKFGAVLGNGVKVGANAVIAPGSILPGNTIVERASLIDQRSLTQKASFADS